MSSAIRVAAATFVLSLAGMANTALADNDPFHGNYDPAYNVCRGTDPICYHDWAGDAGARKGDRVLLYTRTAGPRHANLGTRLAAGLNPPLDASNVVQNTLKAWLQAEGIEMDWTEDVTRLSNLNQYKAVIFDSTSRDTLWAHGRAVDPAYAVNTATSAYLDAAKVNLRQYVRAGGGFVGHPQCVRNRIQLEVVRGPVGQCQLL